MSAEGELKRGAKEGFKREGVMYDVLSDFRGTVTTVEPSTRTTMMPKHMHIYIHINTQMMRCYEKGERERERERSI